MMAITVRTTWAEVKALQPTRSARVTPADQRIRASRRNCGMPPSAMRPGIPSPTTPTCPGSDTASRGPRSPTPRNALPQSFTLDAPTHPRLLSSGNPRRAETDPGKDQRALVRENFLEHRPCPALDRCQQRATPVRAVRRTIGHGHALRLPSPRTPLAHADGQSGRCDCLPRASRTRVHRRTRHACRSRATLISHSDGSGT